MLASPLHSRCYWFVLSVESGIVSGLLGVVPLLQRLFEHFLVSLGFGDVGFLSDKVLPVAFTIFEGSVDFLGVVSDGRFGILAPAVLVAEHLSGEHLDATAQDFEAKELGELVGRDFAAVRPLTILLGDVDEVLTAVRVDVSERLSELRIAFELVVAHTRSEVVVGVEGEDFDALNLREHSQQGFILGFHIVYRFRFVLSLPLIRFILG